MAHVGEPPPPMREVNPNLVCSPNFEDLVMRCIAKDPAARYRTMDAVLQAVKNVHGVSMTGQLAAVNISGAYYPVPTDAPPAVRSSVPAFAAASISGSGASARLAASGSQSMGMLRADGSNAMESAPYSEQPRRSKAWIAVGILVAAVLGGVLGMAAFRITATAGPLAGTPPAVTAPGTGSELSSAGATGAATAAPSATPSAVPEARMVTLKVTSDPPGATVREDATELCASTPCDITFKGDAADPAKTHKLVLQHAGFRPETKSVKAGDAPLHVKLARGGGGFVRPPTPPTTKPTAETAPSGFKELPY
jgi:serine/threonine-protein kinase